MNRLQTNDDDMIREIQIPPTCLSLIASALLSLGARAAAPAASLACCVYVAAAAAAVASSITGSAFRHAVRWSSGDPT